MKKAFLLIIFLFISLNFFAQASFTATGIAVQGIARDANNSAYKNQNITLDFEFFSKTDAGAENATFSAVSKQVVTDNFGVFSTIIDPTFENNAVFANQKVWLRITNKEDSRIIQESQLMHVPYAISANNGVPTGAIMPFIGDENSVPEGWLLCNGASIPSNTATEKLIALLGDTNTPNLKGRFLKGSGTPTEANVDAIGLKGYQDQQARLVYHNHTKGTLAISNNSALNSSTRTVPTASAWQDANMSPIGGAGIGFAQRQSNSVVGFDNTQHEHAITGEIGYKGDDHKENRPSSFGVNYIIKL
jgi:microcystin-dependent protein